VSESQLNGYQTGAVKEERKPEEKTTEDGIWKFWEIERSPDEKVLPIGQAQRPFTGLCIQTRVAHRKRKEMPRNDGTKRKRLYVREWQRMRSEIRTYNNVNASEWNGQRSGDLMDVLAF
jgi:hypothetical protein